MFGLMAVERFNAPPGIFKGRKMRKKIRQHVKQEKRIVKLCFRSGLLDKSKVDVYNLGWECLNRIKGNYVPEVHTYTVDYFGEGDCHGLVGLIADFLYWEFSIPNTGDELTFGYPDSTFRFKSRIWFIKYLSALPKLMKGQKINRILIVSPTF